MSEYMWTVLSHLYVIKYLNSIQNELTIVFITFICHRICERYYHINMWLNTWTVFRMGLLSFSSHLYITEYVNGSITFICHLVPELYSKWVCYCFHHNYMSQNMWTVLSHLYVTKYLNCIQNGFAIIFIKLICHRSCERYYHIYMSLNA